MKFKHQKDIRYNGTGYNAEWIRRHKTEADFVKKCKDLNMPLSEAKCKELYGLATAKDEPVEEVKQPAKK